MAPFPQLARAVSSRGALNIEFVTEFRILLPSIFPYPAVGWRIRMHGAPGVEVSIRFLGGGDAGDVAVEALARAGSGFTLMAKDAPSMALNTSESSKG